MISGMTDLETWGQSSGCALRAIGAAAFDPVSGEVRDTFYANIDENSCLIYGLERDVATVKWWSKQSAEASSKLEENKRPLKEVLVDYLNWWERNRLKEFWAYGTNFDEVILGYTMRLVGLTVPWHYRNVRCARTVIAIAGLEIDRTNSVYHYALDDCYAQINTLHKAYKKLGLVE